METHPGETVFTLTRSGASISGYGELLLFTERLWIRCIVRGILRDVMYPFWIPFCIRSIP